MVHNHGLGCKKDFYDGRDLFYRDKRKIVHLPGRASLRKFAIPSLDQLTLGSCTGHGYVHGYAALTNIKMGEYSPLSTLMAYLNGRVIENTVDEDSGAMIRDTIKGAAKWGVCHSDLWPYDIEKFAETPPPDAYDDAVKHQLLKFHRCVGLEDVRASVAESFPVIYGFDVYSSFDDPVVAETGLVPIPNTDKETYLGGHCNLFLEYNQSTQLMTSQNSYGPAFGDYGFIYIPYQFFDMGLISDCWALELGEEM